MVCLMNHQRMRVCVLFLVLLVILMIVELSQSARGVRARSRGGSRGRSRNRSLTRSSSGSSLKPKITRYTPIPATSVRSPVIVNQTKLGLRSGTFKKVVTAYLVHRYVFSNAPVYRSGYPLYRSYVTIPVNRAMRLSHDEEKLLDNQDELCLEKLAGNRTLEEGIDQNLVELNTTVKYRDEIVVKLHELVNNTISLKDIKDQDFKISNLARYNTSIVAGTTCTQVAMTVQGTMVIMYERNPNRASLSKINNKLLLVVFSLFAFFKLFFN